MSEKRDEDLKRAWNSWLEQPPRQSPEEAARAVLERLPESNVGARAGTSFPLWRPIALAALLLVAVVTAWRWDPAPEVAPVAMAAIESPEPALEDGVLLIWLDSETPLYLTLASDSKERMQESNLGDLL